MAKAHIGPFLHSILFLILLLITVNVVPSMVIDGSADGAEVAETTVTFTKVGKNSWSGTEESEFVFTATISSDGKPDHPVELVVEYRGYTMREVNPGDSNFSDGKEYQYIGTFDGGPKFYYFRCGNVTSGVSTFNVKESHFFEEYHPDLLAAIGIFVIPLIYVLILLNRLKRHTIVISKHMRRLVSSTSPNGTDRVPPADRIPGQFRMVLIILLALIMLLLATPEVEGASIQFSHSGLQPGSGTEDTTFMFMVRVTSAEQPEAPILIVINDAEHEMREMIPNDTNFADGKEFYYRQRLSEGGVVYFFRSGNTTTDSRMLSVGETNRIQYHYDVALVTGVMIVPVLIGIITFRRIEREFKELADTLSGVSGNDPGGDDPGNESQMGRKEAGGERERTGEKHEEILR